MNFSERLRELRKSSSLTQPALAQIARISERAMRKFESGENLPNLAVLLPLADYFDVSLDYLVGRSDDPKGGIP